ncbi:hypothetical protein HNP82_003554 [Catenibacillus scindens]|uniref:Uncharacterized protein n=1 Tax=Catenibacillus scindens TaxID=673271 RepID=A0A7W8HEX7_9FIRM|nr:hypothetical protein [Catenibacillus scindens]MBB5266397.1 hypothetical protein [Catenibacillus scindens]
MVIFATTFYVTKELTKERFIELAFEWINGSPHYGFDNISWSGEDLYEKECEKQKFSVVQSNDRRILAIRLENIDNDNVVWTNDFVYEERDVNNMLLVRLARDAVDKESIVPKKYNRPRLMKTILKLGYGAEDNNLLISDQEILITKDNVDLAESIICGRAEYLLPVVYVTKRFVDNNTILDTKELAKDLAGTAHVVVEENTEITSELKERTDGFNPFNGAVHIYYSDKVGTRIVPDEFSKANAFRFKIVNSVCRRLSLIKIEDKYTWGTIRYQRLLEKYRQDQKQNLELEKVCEEILAIKEKEHAQLVEDLEIELNELRNKVQSYEYAFQNRKKEQIGNIVFDCSEEEFFEGEIKDMVLNVLLNEKEKMDTDPNQKGWRKYHVLSALLQDNEIIGKGEELEKELKSILGRNNRINTKDRRRLSELGFVSREGKHNKLYFHNDDRYLITLGKTPSDSRSAPNSASTATKTIICTQK